jgi:hypothetical protein
MTDTKPYRSKATACTRLCGWPATWLKIPTKSLKICIRDDADDSQVADELKILRHLQASSGPEVGKELMRLPEAIFEVDGHSCIVSKPYACCLQTLQDLLPEGKVPAVVLRA